MGAAMLGLPASAQTSPWPLPPAVEKELAARGPRYLDFLGSRNPSTVAFGLKVFLGQHEKPRAQVLPGGLGGNGAPARETNAACCCTAPNALVLLNDGDAPD